MDDSALNGAEWEVISLLSEAWDRFSQLPMRHPDDAREFKSAIHAAQNIIMCRPVEFEEYCKNDKMKKVE